MGNDEIFLLQEEVSIEQEIQVDQSISSPGTPPSSHFHLDILKTPHEGSRIKIRLKLRHPIDEPVRKPTSHWLGFISVRGAKQMNSWDFRDPLQGLTAILQPITLVGTNPQINLSAPFHKDSNIIFPRNGALPQGLTPLWRSSTLLPAA